MIGGRGGAVTAHPGSVVLGTQTREGDELSVEVGLIVVAIVPDQIRPGRLRMLQESAEGSALSEQHVVRLRDHPGTST